jgi:integrase
LYEKWSGQYFENLKSDSSARTITAAWAYCSALYDIRVKDIRPRHIKWVMENGEVTIQRGKKKGEKQKASAGTKARIKSMFNLLLDYAQENEYVTTNYARLFEVSKDIIIEKSKATRSHMVFQDSEMESLWKGAGTIKYADLVLIQCYSGLRPQELGLITLDNVHLDENYIVGGMKTAAGTSRIIPIHPKIKSFVEKYLDEARELKSDYLINASDSINGLKMTYDKYAHRFDAVIEVLHLNSEHRPHDPRTTFVTMAKKAGVDEYVLKMVIGHQITDVTEKYYTKRNIEWLFEEIKKI